MSSNSVRVTNLPATQPVSGTVTATGPLTDTQLRATAVPVSGTVTASGPLTDTQLRATAVPVSGTLTAVTTVTTVTTVTAVTAITNALPAGTNAIGKLAANAGVNIGDVTAGLNQLNISQTPTVSTSPAYIAGDALGGLLTFANAARSSGGSGTVTAITLMCKTPALIPQVDLYLFNQTFTAITDNAAFAPSDGDMANCIGVIPITAWAAEVAGSLNSIATWRGAHGFNLTGTSLFAQMVSRSGFTAAGTTDFIIGLQVARD